MNNLCDITPPRVFITLMYFTLTNFSKTLKREGLKNLGEEGGSLKYILQRADWDHSCRRCSGRWIRVGWRSLGVFVFDGKWCVIK